MEVPLPSVFRPLRLCAAGLGKLWNEKGAGFCKRVPSIVKSAPDSEGVMEWSAATVMAVLVFTAKAYILFLTRPNAERNFREFESKDKCKSLQRDLMVEPTLVPKRRLTSK